MDFNLDILLPKALNLKDIYLYEDLVEWGGETYRRDPPVYNWNDKLILVENSLPTIYGNFLDNYINLKDYEVLTLKGGGLSELEWAVNKDGDITETPLIEFINTSLAKISGWGLILSLDDEKIGAVKKVDNPLICSSILVEALKWEEPHGVIILNKLKSI